MLAAAAVTITTHVLAVAGCPVVDEYPHQVYIPSSGCQMEGSVAGRCEDFQLV